MKSLQTAFFSLALSAFLSSCGPAQGIRAVQRDAGLTDLGAAADRLAPNDARPQDSQSADSAHADTAVPDTAMPDAARPDTTVGPDATRPPTSGSSPSTCDDLDCSGHGICILHDDQTVCACDPGFSPGDALGLSCVPTKQVCPGGALAQPYDVDNDGEDENIFYPTDDDKRMYELLNYTRATHDMKGAPECFRPLAYNLTWSAHGRNHSYKMQAQGGLFHEDFPFGQNCAYGTGPEGEINMYMTGANEPHCPYSSHHCNIMQCRYSSVGIGTVGTWNMQNFLLKPPPATPMCCA